MTDRELIAAIHRLDRPIEPDPAFADALFLHLCGEGRAQHRLRPALLVAAAILLAAAALTALVGARLLHPPRALPGAFLPAGSGLDHRDFAAVAMLADGRVLIVGGTGHDTEPLRGEVYDPAEDRFTETGPMSTPRTAATATTLADGRVLVAGGTYSGDDGNPIAVGAAELFDPETAQFTQTGAMAHARAGQTATLLDDGRVLVVGGATYDAGRPIPLASAEIYDPGSGNWSETAQMPEPRVGHMATRMADGRVLIAGGESDGGAEGDAISDPLASALVFDPHTGAFTPVSPMSTARGAATATLLRDGRVLVVGGFATAADAREQDSTLASAELFDPASGTFTPTGSLTSARSGHAATLLADGTGVISGGFNGHGGLHTAELYDPASGTFRVGATAAGEHHTIATLLTDGQVLMADGDGPELFDPTGDVPGAATASGAIAERVSAGPGPSEIGPGSTEAASSGATARPGPPSGSPSAGDADAGFRVTGPPRTDRTGHTATRLADGRVLIAGGQATDDRLPLASAELYDPRTGTFTPTGSLAEPRAGHTALLLADGRVLVAGGLDGNASLTTLEVYDPLTGAFALAATGPAPDAGMRHQVRLAQAPDGQVLEIGPTEVSGAGAVTAITELDPSDWSRKLLTDVGDCYPFDAAMSSDGRLLLLCMGGSAGLDLLLRVFDPATATVTTEATTSTHGGGNLVVLPDGRILVVNGDAATDLAIFDPHTGTIRDTGRALDPNIANDVAAVPLADGRVLVLGTDSLRAWDPATGAETELASPGLSRDAYTVTRLDDGRILLVGGGQWPADSSAPRPAAAELFDPSAIR